MESSKQTGLKKKKQIKKSLGLGFRVGGRGVEGALPETLNPKPETWASSDAYRKQPRVQGFEVCRQLWLGLGEPVVNMDAYIMLKIHPTFLNPKP